MKAPKNDRIDDLPDQQAHLREAERVRLEIYRRMTPSQRLEAGLSLYRMARTMKTAYIRYCHPDWSEQQVHEAVKEIFSRVRD